MRKVLFLLLSVILSGTSFADDKPAPAPRVSIFSTSTDWEGVTGLNLAEYRGKIISDTRLVGRGLVLYYLDGFPCYGLGDGVRVWIGPNGKEDHHLRIACGAAPKQIQFAYSHVSRDADDATTQGLLTCNVSDYGRDLTIDLSDCTVGPDWDEYK